MNNYQRPHSPFEDSAKERLRRMGLTTEDGSPERDAMAVFGNIFAGQFFDDLCDYYQNYKDVQETIAQIFHTAEQADLKQKFLLICLQYDNIYRALPDPVWWISGSPAFAELFAEDFLAHLKRLAGNTYVTVLISCRKPAKIAGKVSPIEALRYTDTGTNSRRKIKKTTGGASIPQMALANLGRNKKRTFTVICSLTLGLVLLTAVYAQNASFDIDKYMSQTVISDFEVKDSSIASNFTTYDPHGTTISRELVRQIDSLDGLEATGYLYSQVFTHPIGPSALANIQTYYQANDRLTSIEAVDPGLAQDYHDMITSGECTAILYGVDGLILDVFSENYRILDGTFDKEKFLSGSYLLAEAASGAEEKEKKTQPTYSVGDTVELNGRQYEVMGIVANITSLTEGINGDTAEFLSFYLPATAFQELYPDNTIRKMFFDVTDEHQPQAEQMLLAYRDSTDKSLTFTSKTTLIEHYQEQTRANTVIGLAISIIIADVGILNFINSMVTAIISRQKEFAVIQSIGMTKRQLRRMLIDEGLYYAGSTLIASYAVGAVAVAVGVRAMLADSWTSTFHFTILPLVICTPLLIGFSILIPYLCFRNLEKQSVIERLRAVN